MMVLSRVLACDISVLVLCSQVRRQLCGLMGTVFHEHMLCSLCQGVQDTVAQSKVPGSLSEVTSLLSKSPKNPPQPVLGMEATIPSLGILVILMYFIPL